MPIN
ncbi:hypothetical protein IEO21_08407 [Rhodonia placenta]|jgi:hypothetical protein